MSLTVQDFIDMVRDEMKAAGLRRRDKVVRRLRAKYGCFVNPNARMRPRLLTAAGIDEYHVVKAWLASGAKRALKPAHPCDHVSNRRTAQRKVPLYEWQTTEATGRKVQSNSPKQRAPKPAPQPAVKLAPRFPPAIEQLKKLKQSTVALYLRKALMDIAARSTTDKPTRNYIGEVLDACHADLREMLND